MANYNYIISEVQFFEDKDKETTHNFVNGTGIDLNSACTSKRPTIAEIKNASVELGLEVSEISTEDNRIEIAAKKNSSSRIWMIFAGIEYDDVKVNLFQIGKGSDIDLTIDLIQYLGKIHGNFLFYNDSGIMSLITPEKKKEIILNEING